MSINKKVLCCLGVAIVIIFTLAVLLFGKSENEKYYDKIYSAFESSDEVRLDDIFEFDFDSAYVVGASELYWDKELFAEKLDVGFAVDIKQFESDNRSRILFINDGTVIYDFIYHRDEIYVDNDGLTVYPNSVMKRIQKDFGEYTPNVVIEFQTEE